MDINFYLPTRKEGISIVFFFILSPSLYELEIRQHQHLTEQGMIHEVWKTTKRVGMQKAHKKVRDTCKKRRCHRHATDVALSLYSCFESISAALTFSWSKHWSSRFQSENERANRCLMFLPTRGKFELNPK